MFLIDQYVCRKSTFFNLETLIQMNNGMLIGENVLMMVEALSKSDQEVQTNYAAVSTCSSKSIFNANVCGSKYNWSLTNFRGNGRMRHCRHHLPLRSRTGARFDVQHN